MQVKKLAIIGANDFQNRLILKAKEKGYETHVFAWASGDIGEKTADYFYPISIVEKEQILEVCRTIQPDGIISIASDLASITVNYVAEQLGLTGNGMESAIRATNKNLMRIAFEENGLPSPKSRKVSGMEDLDLTGMSYPLIVKPTDRSGSRGIFKIEDSSQLPFAIERAKAESFEKKALVEEFAQGEEFSVEYVSYRGEHHFLAITRKYTTGAPLFIETGHIEPANLPEEIENRIKELVPKALDALGIKNGASHSELKIDEKGEIRFIEIGGRMGGDCIGSDLVYLSTGYDFVEMVIDIACGKEPDLMRRHEPSNAAVRFIFNQKDLENLSWVKENAGEMIHRVSEIEPIDERSIQDSSARFGYYILVSDDRNTLGKVMEKIHE